MISFFFLSTYYLLSRTLSITRFVCKIHAVKFGFVYWDSNCQDGQILFDILKLLVSVPWRILSCARTHKHVLLLYESLANARLLNILGKIISMTPKWRSKTMMFVSVDNQTQICGTFLPSEFRSFPLHRTDHGLPIFLSNLWVSANPAVRPFPFCSMVLNPSISIWTSPSSLTRLRRFQTRPSFSKLIQHLRRRTFAMLLPLPKRLHEHHQELSLLASPEPIYNQEASTSLACWFSPFRAELTKRIYPSAVKVSISFRHLQRLHPQIFPKNSYRNLLT